MVSEEEPEREGSGCAAVTVAVIVVAVPLALLWRAYRDAFIIAVWVIAWGAVVWAARRPNKIDNPSPPPPAERGPEKEPQISMMRDQSHPNRWVVTRPSRWLTETHDKEG